jgi:glucose/arabinose dehydrogenase
MPSLSLHRGLAVALLALISAQVLAQSAAAPGTFKLTPRVGVDLQPIAVHIPAQFGHLPDTLSVNLPPGFSASVFAAFEEFDRPRFMAFDDAGVLHVANMNADQIIALPDHDGDGAADEAIVVASGFERPHSLGFYDGDLYVGDRGQIVRFMDGDGDGIYEEREVFADDIPSSGGHSTRTLVIDEKGGKMYLGVGWPCDLCRRDDGAERGAVLQFNLDGSGRRVYANGMRNPIGLAIHPASGELWGTNNGHDLEGVDGPPEWIDVIRDGSFHGMPFAYGYQVWADFSIPAYRDKILPLTAADSALVATMEPPVALLPAHLAPMGIHFYNHDRFPARFRHAAFVALHAGHAKLAPIEGYSVITLFSDLDGSNARVADFMTGFQTGTEIADVWGFPVGIAGDADGRLYVSSDLGNPLILRVEHGPVVANWRTDLPDTLRPGATLAALGTVRVERLDPDAGAVTASADFSALGGPGDLQLLDAGEGRFELGLHMSAPTGVPPGLKTVSVTVRQAAVPRPHVVRLTRQIALLPRGREDLVVFDEELAAGWRVQHHTWVEKRRVDLEEDGLVHSGALAARFSVVRSNWDWVVRFRPKMPVDPLGFERLRFAFHAGLLDRDPTDDFNVYVADGLLDLVEEGYVDITSKEWQVVEVPLSRFGPASPIKEITFGGDFSKPFYLDDIRLAAAAQITSVTDGGTNPVAFELGANYPNPFNSGTVIPFDLAFDDDVRLSVYNLAGQRVRRLVNAPLTAGHHRLRWSGHDDDGRTLASGVYFYRLQSGARWETRKLILIR